MLDGQITFERMNDRSFWQRMAPTLNVENQQLFADDRLFRPDDAGIAERRKRLKTEGYFEIENLPWTLPLEDMAAMVAALARRKLPPAFAFVYDEFWAIYHALNRFIEPILGEGFYRLPDFWVW
jgi:hypothetical protein